MKDIIALLFTLLFFAVFCSLVAFTVWYTNSPWALLGFILWPGVKVTTPDENTKIPEE